MFCLENDKFTEICEITTNDEDLLKRTFSNYFKINTHFESQIYMI